MPRPRASQTPSFALEFASSFVVCAALATLDVQATLARKYLGPILERVGARALADDDAAVTLALLFVNLAIVFSPSYQALTRGAANNPTAYALKGMLGDTRAATGVRERVRGGAGARLRAQGGDGGDANAPRVSAGEGRDRADRAGGERRRRRRRRRRPSSRRISCSSVWPNARSPRR